jgi:Mrp family chromosome partitioning ATPase/capsular polysaccharide biosynthesis protein
VHGWSLAEQMSDDTNLPNFIAMLRRQRLLVAVAAVLAAGVAFVVSSLQPTEYTSSARILYAAAVTPVGAPNEDPARALDTLVGLAKNPTALTAAARAAHVSVQQLDDATSVSSDPNADLMKITATARSPRSASALANALASSFVDWRASGQENLIRARIASLQAQIAQLAGRGGPSAVAVVSDLRLQLAEARSQLAVPTADVTIVNPALTPKHPSSPHPLRNGAIGLVAGLLIGLFGASLRDRLDRRLRSVEEVEEIYDCPSLGVIPYIADAGRGDRRAAVGDFRANSSLATSFRAVRTNLTLLVDDVKTVIVSSAVPGEGKTTATANIARAFAAVGKVVLAVSADVRSPALHRYFGTESPLELLTANLDEVREHPPARASDVLSRRAGMHSATDAQAGLIEVLAGEVPLEAAVRTYPVTGPSGRLGKVAVLANARRFFDPGALYQSNAMARFLEQVRGEYDVVLIDTPPILASAESTLLSTAGDAVVLVAQLGVLTRKQAHRAARVMASVGVVPRGVIITGRAEDEISDYGYGYGPSPSQLSRRLGRLEAPRRFWRSTRSRRRLAAPSPSSPEGVGQAPGTSEAAG